ncbi:Uma2 family endonuclease [soil metagenome]
MPATATPPTDAPATVSPISSPLDRPFRLTIDRYYQMIESGIFHEKEPVYLWRGRLVEKMTKGRNHTIATTSLYRGLDRLVPQGFYVEQEQPMAIIEDGLPEPDLMIVRGALRDFQGRPPTTKDVVLVVEVADSSLAVDRGDVLATYASEGIPVYWIVNLPGRRVEVYNEPTGPANPSFYRLQRTYGPEEDVPVVLEGREVGRIAVRDLLP